MVKECLRGTLSLPEQPRTVTDLDARVAPELADALAAFPPIALDDERLPRVRAALDRAVAPRPTTVRIDDHMATGQTGHEILIRTYRPLDSDHPRPALYWIHGGGLVLSSVRRDDASCAAIAVELDIVVASVEYRLAPEHVYPAAIEDTYDGWQFINDHASTLGIDKTRVALGGASAGAGLAAALTLLVRDRGAPMPSFQLLRYPMLDDRALTPSSRAVVDPRVWNRESNAYGWNAYLNGRAGAADVPAYAAAARADDLSGLPPAVITVGDLDLFLDENVDYAQRLDQAGVATELRVYPGAFHGAPSAAPDAPIIGRWRGDEHDALRRALGLPAGSAR